MRTHRLPSARGRWRIFPIRVCRRWHRYGWWALASGGVLGIAAFWPDLVAGRGCLFWMLTGWPCMFCGWIRAFVACTRGQWSLAVRDAPLAVIVWGLVVMTFLWNTVALLRRRDSGPHPIVQQVRHQPARWLLLAVLAILLNWFYRLSNGLS